MSILNIIWSIVASLLAISLFIGILKGLGQSEGYKIKELELEHDKTKLELQKEIQKTLRLESTLVRERVQKSNLMMEILGKCLFDMRSSSEEIVENMKHNWKVMYKEEEL